MLHTLQMDSKFQNFSASYLEGYGVSRARGWGRGWVCVVSDACGCPPCPCCGRDTLRCAARRGETWPLRAGGFWLSRSEIQRHPARQAGCPKSANPCTARDCGSSLTSVCNQTATKGPKRRGEQDIPVLPFGSYSAVSSSSWSARASSS